VLIRKQYFLRNSKLERQFKTLLAPNIIKPKLNNLLYLYYLDQKGSGSSDEGRWQRANTLLNRSRAAQSGAVMQNA